MSEPLGEFAHRHVASTYAAREGGGVISTAHWEGLATGYGAVFGSLIFDVPDGATSGSIQWVGQAFPEGTPYVNGSGSGTWEQVEGAHCWNVHIPLLTVSNGDRRRCEGQVDVATRTFTGKMYQAD